MRAATSRFRSGQMGASLIVVLLCAASLAGLALLMRGQQRTVVAAVEIAGQIDADGHLRPLADVEAAVRSMELVTTRIHTTVHKTVEDRCWRGTARASVEAPATFLYGVDLSRLRSADLWLDPFTRTYLVRIPEPRRLAVEVDPAAAREQVSVSGLRLRRQAGEHVLGLARRDLYDEACRSAIPQDRLRQVREDSLRQVEALLASVCGPGARVAAAYASDGEP